MNFEKVLMQAKEGDSDAILEIIETYKPLLIRNAIVNGRFDEDLYQELVRFYNLQYSIGISFFCLH